MSNIKKSLEGKRVILMGASSGIGFATAKAAAEEGANIVIVSSNQQRIDTALTELPAGSEGYAVDLSKEENIKNFFSKIGRFDHLVFSAGENLTLNSISETNIDQARDFFTLRFWAPFAAIKYGAASINEAGSISLTSGTASARPGAGWSVASAICGAIEGFVRAMAVELAPVRVNCVVPGVIKTPLWDSIPASDREGLYQYVSNSVLAKRVGEAEDVAEGFLYLMKQKHGTGQSLVIDGGTLLV
ncbi:SDR family oxidoreductase [Mucilaginibacter sp. SG564]|uniref:SDR family oxidoreductase n=1 Tax=Mucilaginibacter sp. SG564 TaxID=2587022 RepID=UPI001551FA4B|nr:SDR family oxidoreductase [Mucilaginibacter sp. SG564]NOW94980.1 NAD(P)-dependent dehydrogenase (short-subunit alcohol dehydrogenase family) [Mucilaginibacter sp. SG564]